MQLATHPYSILSACVGSILHARKAGTALAISEVSNRLPIIAAKTAWIKWTRPV